MYSHELWVFRQHYQKHTQFCMDSGMIQKNHCLWTHFVAASKNVCWYLAHQQRHHYCWTIYTSFGVACAAIQRTSFSGKTLLQQDNGKPQSVWVFNWPACNPDLSPTQIFGMIINKTKIIWQIRPVEQLKSDIWQDWGNILPSKL